MLRLPLGAESDALSHWLKTLEARHHVPIDLGLRRCGEVYERLGAPRPGQKVISVAGTNGKGSTVAWACTCLGALGHSHGAYTSPHLFRFTERLRLNGEQVTERALVEAFEAVEAARRDVSLTYFEFTTLACLLLMAEAKLDVAVLEVGMGGRLDTVNLVDADLAIITPIGLDHQAFLGDDRLTIGREKAGILREGKPLVCSDRRPPLSIRERARELGCPMLRIGRQFDLEPGVAADPESRSATQDTGQHKTAGAPLAYRQGDWHMALPPLPLPGAHQRDNLAAALAAVLNLFPDRFPPDAAAEDVLASAVAATRLPARSQRYGSGPGFIVDVGHNPMAAETIARSLDTSKPVICVLAMLADKDAESVALALRGTVERFICAGLEDGRRTQSGPALQQRIAAVIDDRPVESRPTVSSALVEASRRASEHQPVLVFGSFYTAAEAIGWLHERGLEQVA